MKDRGFRAVSKLLYDVEAFNAALERYEHFPTCSRDVARQRGRYVIETASTSTS